MWFPEGLENTPLKSRKEKNREINLPMLSLDRSPALFSRIFPAFSSRYLRINARDGTFSFISLTSFLKKIVKSTYLCYL